MFRTASLNFDAAKNQCQAKGGNLVSIGSASEQNYVWQKMKSLLRRRTQYWIGMRKDPVKGR